MTTPFTIEPIYPTLHDKICEQIALARRAVQTATCDGMDVVIIGTRYSREAQTLTPEYLGFRFEPCGSVLPGEDLTNQDRSVSHVYVVLAPDTLRQKKEKTL